MLIRRIFFTIQKHYKITHSQEQETAEMRKPEVRNITHITLEVNRSKTQALCCGVWRRRFPCVKAVYQNPVQTIWLEKALYKGGVVIRLPNPNLELFPNVKGNIYNTVDQKMTPSLFNLLMNLPAEH